jgi:hypothetical protein
MTSRAIACPECGSTELFWAVRLINRSDAGDGRLHLRDISPVLVLRCDGCAEAIYFAYADSARGEALLARIGGALDD